MCSQMYSNSSCWRKDLAISSSVMSCREIVSLTLTIGEKRTPFREVDDDNDDEVVDESLEMVESKECKDEEFRGSIEAMLVFFPSI